MKLGKFIEKSNDFMPYNVSIQEVLNSMISNKIKHVVLLENEEPKAIITERDILFLYTKHVNFNNPVIDYATKNLICAKENRKLEYALSLMVDNYIRRVIIVNQEKKYVGSISQEDIIFEFEQDVYKSHIKINELIKPINKAIHIENTQTLQDAINIMTENNIGSVLVYKNNKEPIGIITESDVVAFAQKNIDTSENVALYMHFPIISFSENEFLHNIVKTMKEKNIRRILINNHEDNEYYVITSKDILNNLKGNYSIYLESKLRDVKNTFNLLDEIVLELFDYEDEQIIHWHNTKAKELFEINIDDEITKVIPKDTWDDIYKKIKNKNYNDDKVFKINNRLYKIIAMHSIVLNNSVIKILFDDVTELMEDKNKEVDVYKESLELLPSAVSIINDKFEIIYQNEKFNLDSSELKNIIKKENIDFIKQESCTFQFETNKKFLYKRIKKDLFLINIY